MPRRLATGAAAALILAVSGAAAAKEKPPELVGAPEAKAHVGATDFRVLFWRVFHASLWSKDGAFDWEQPFALSLTYARDFTDEQLADRTVEEMSRISGQPEAALQGFGAEFASCVDDVGPGDRITAISVDADKARLFQNGQERCTLQRQDLRRHFFGIWLNRDSSFPDATTRLIGDRR